MPFAQSRRFMRCASFARFKKRLADATLIAALAAFASGCAIAPVDGPPDKVPAGIERTPDAVPRIEPLAAGGANKPYTVAGRSYVPLVADVPFAESGLASWYGRKFHGRPTSSGEPYDMFAMTAAHRTLPIPSYVRVRNPANGREVIVRVNDRGPFPQASHAEGRIIDLSYAAAARLGVLGAVAPVTIRRITNADMRAGRLLGDAGSAAAVAAHP